MPKKPAGPELSTRRHHQVFFWSSVIMLVTMLGMVWQDHYREWKTYQREFRQLDVDNTRRKIAELEAAIDQNAYQAVQQRLAQAQATVDARRSEVTTLEAEIRDQDNERGNLDQKIKFAKADLSSIRFEVDEITLLGKDVTRKQRQYDALQARIEEDTRALEAVETGLAAKREALAAIVGGRDAAGAELETIERKVVFQRQRLARLQERLKTMVRNAPLLDFMSPSLKINQIIVNTQEEELNFVKVPRVDRCTTCHLGIAQEGFEEAPQPYTTHPQLDLFLGAASPHPMDQVGCTGCHFGRGRATTFQSAVHTPRDAAQKAEWEEKYHWHPDHYWAEPMLPAQSVEASCYKCHKGVAEIPRGTTINAGIRLVERYGCFGCHAIQGFEDLRKAGPDLRQIARKSTPEWVAKWINDPKQVRPGTKMPAFFHQSNMEGEAHHRRNDVEVLALTAYLFDRSETGAYPPPPVAGDAAAGRDLVDTLGCKACHVVGEEPMPADIMSRRLFGPPLRGIAHKTSEAWLFQWLKDPTHYFPETRMPDLRLSDREAADITAYLMTLDGPDIETIDAPQPDPEWLDWLALEYLTRRMTEAQARDRLAGMSESERLVYVGDRLVQRYGCFGCHLIPGYEETKGIGTELTEEGSKMLKKLDFGAREGKLEHTKVAWFTQKLTDPRSFDWREEDGQKKFLVKSFEEKLKMPNFHFQEEEIQALVTFILGMTREQVPPGGRRDLDAVEQAAERGRREIENRNCRGCHVIEGRGGEYAEVLEAQFAAEGKTAAEAAAFAPPPLSYEAPYDPALSLRADYNGQGEKVQPEWLFGFFKAPSPIRPWLQVRMPTFGLDDAAATHLVEYFSVAAHEPFPYETMDVTRDPAHIRAAKALLSPDYFNCYTCHVQGDKNPPGDPSRWAPNLNLAPQRLKADWILKWLEDPQQVQPGTKMPSFYPGGPPDVLGGDEARQREAIRDYLMTQGE